jgi:acyl-homoserine-lactone acylase
MTLRRPGRRSTRRAGALLLAGALVAAACSGDDDTAPAATDDATPTTAAETTAPDTTAPEVTAPETTAAPEVEDATYTATIRRTADGVPHVLADDLPSLGFGHGYAFAEDHACSLADAVVQVRSEAARWFGRGTDDRWVDQDLVYLALDLQGRGAAGFDAAAPELQDQIRGYAAGFNHYLEEVGGDALAGYCAGAEWVGPIDEYDLAAYYTALSWRASVDPLKGYIASAQPPAPAGDTTGGDEDASGTDTSDTVDAETAAALARLVPEATELASNAWAIGPDRSATGEAMLVGNPHFPWQGMLRFHEVHLTVPGEVDVYGVTLLGSPAVNIGFTEGVAWSHTVSAGGRFTAYTLDLVPGDPTSYRYGDEVRQMTSTDVSVEVLEEDGSIGTVERTMWSSHYGPIIDFPGLGWSDTLTLTFRDANADNDELIPQFAAMNQAQSMDELIEAHATWQGIPWVNTIAASADGRIWYADTSATPNLSPEAIAAWEERLTTDPFTQIALDNRIVLLDGSDPLFEWVDDPAARDPGVVPFEAMPQLERSDFVFNANDPYWLAHPDELLGGFSPLHGLAERPVSNRTRGNAVQLSPDRGDSGTDGLFEFTELRDSAVGNRVFTAEALLDEVLVRCGDDAASIPELAPICEVLAGWDRRVDLDSVGAALWREFIDSFSNAELTDAGPLWAQPFDPADPVGTPSGLSPEAAVAERLLAAAEVLRAAGFDIDTPLGEIQFGSLRDVAGDLIYAFRVMRLPLLDAGGAPIGRLDDIVVVPGRPGEAPRVVGFVASSQRRRIFVNAARVAELDSDGARLRSWDVDLNPFKPRPGEILIGADSSTPGRRRDRQRRGAEAGDRRAHTVVGDRQGPPRPPQRAAPPPQLPPRRLRRGSRPVRRPHGDGGRGRPAARHAPVRRRRDRARAAPTQRKQLAEAMDDERLADVLEELPEAEQLRMIEGLDLERL